MAAGVRDFLANFRGGGARPNRYEVIMTFPGTVPNGVRVSEKISFTCTATTIPSATLGTAIVPFMGRQVKLPGDRTFEDWTVTVVLDNDWLGRRAFEQWHDQMLGFTDNLAEQNMLNPINAFGVGIVNQLDRADNVIERYEVEGIFPTLVGEVQLGYDQNDMVALQQVTFAVNNWTNRSIS